MSITRLQQARQMYALGKLVERVGFRGGGMDMGNASNQAQSAAMGGGNNNNNKGSDRPETTRHNPHTDSGTSKTSVATGDEMRSAAKDFVQTLNTNNAIEAAKTGTKFTPYGGGSKNYKEPFFNTGLGKIVKGVGMFYAPQIFGPKFATGMKLYKGAKVAKDFLDQTDILSTLDVKNPIANLFSGNKTSTSKSKSKSKSTKKNNITTNNGGGDGEGIASLDNQASGYDEYILLLQKLQSGNISDSERNRFSVLKNMLGI